MAQKLNNRNLYLTSITVIALIFLLAVQIIWTFNAAQQEESNFSHLATIAMTNAQAEIMNKFPNCCQKMGRVVGKKGQCQSLGKRESQIDSIINKHLRKHALNLDYSFIIQNANNTDIPTSNKSTKYAVNYTSPDSAQIRIEFPNRNQFLINQMKGIFISSLVFIAILAAAFFQLMRLLKLEKQKYSETENFINNMVHEFQTPISNIKLSANMLSKSITNPSAETERFIEIIKSENKKLHLNTLQILNLNEITNKETCGQITDIHKKINECVAVYSIPKFKLDLRAANSSIYANPNHIEHVLSNLIDNAIKYSTDGQTIVISTSSNAQQIILKVTDEGIGIAKEDFCLIFEKYYRVNNHDIHNVKGFGLGLAYVKQIIESLNGTIKVDSTLGLGSTFTVTLPLHKELTQ